MVRMAAAHEMCPRATTTSHWPFPLFMPALPQSVPGPARVVEPAAALVGAPFLLLARAGCGLGPVAPRYAPTAAAAITAVPAPITTAARVPMPARPPIRSCRRAGGRDRPVTSGVSWLMTASRLARAGVPAVAPDAAAVGPP